MKNSEVREFIKNYTREDWQFVLMELYKKVPKEHKEEGWIDDMIRTPEEYREFKGRPKSIRFNVTLESIEEEILDFIEDFREGNYYTWAKDSPIPKKARSKWKHLVKHLFDDIVRVSEEAEKLPMCAKLMRGLYEAICYAEKHLVVETQEPFMFLKLTDEEFFGQMVAFDSKVLERTEFVEHVVRILGEYKKVPSVDVLIPKALEMLPDDEGKKMMIEKAKEMRSLAEVQISEHIEAVKLENPKVEIVEINHIPYRDKEEVNIYTKIVFYCNGAMGTWEDGINDLWDHYLNANQEIVFYVLIHLLFNHKQQEWILKEFKRAEDKKIHPRASLRDLKRYIINKKILPPYIKV